jgi:hypothetical protein
MDCWFNSFLDLIEATKEEKENEIPESVKHLYS